MKKLNTFYTNQEFVNMFEMNVKRKEHIKETKKFFTPLEIDDAVNGETFNLDIKLKLDKPTRFIFTKTESSNELVQTGLPLSTIFKNVQ